MYLKRASRHFSFVRSRRSSGGLLGGTSNWSPSAKHRWGHRRRRPPAPRRTAPHLQTLSAYHKAPGPAPGLSPCHTPWRWPRPLQGTYPPPASFFSISSFIVVLLLKMYLKRASRRFLISCSVSLYVPPGQKGQQTFVFSHFTLPFPFSPLISYYTPPTMKPQGRDMPPPAVRAVVITHAKSRSQAGLFGYIRPCALAINTVKCSIQTKERSPRHGDTRIRRGV